MYLNDNELLELTLATIDQMGTYFFLIIECQQGRICYASNSIETVLGYKPVCRKKTRLQNSFITFLIKGEICLQSIFDIVYPDDAEMIKQQLINEKKTSSASNEESPSDSKCKNFIL